MKGTKAAIGKDFRPTCGQRIANRIKAIFAELRRQRPVQYDIRSFSGKVSDEDERKGLRTVRMTQSIAETAHKYSNGSSSISRLGMSGLPLRVMESGLQRFAESEETILKRVEDLVDELHNGTIPNDIQVSGELFSGSTTDKGMALLIEAVTDAICVKVIGKCLIITERVISSDECTRVLDPDLLPGSKIALSDTNRQHCIGEYRYNKNFWKLCVDELVEKTPAEIRMPVAHPGFRTHGAALEYGETGFSKIMTRTLLKYLIQVLPSIGLSMENPIREDDQDTDPENVKKWRHALRIQANMIFEAAVEDVKTEPKVSRDEFIKQHAELAKEAKEKRERHLAFEKSRGEFVARREETAKRARETLSKGELQLSDLEYNERSALKKQNAVEAKRARQEGEGAFAARIDEWATRLRLKPSELRVVREKYAKGETSALSGYEEPFPDEWTANQPEQSVKRRHRSAGASVKMRTVYATDNEAQRHGHFKYSSTGQAWKPEKRWRLRSEERPRNEHAEEQSRGRSAHQSRQHSIARSQNRWDGQGSQQPRTREERQWEQSNAWQEHDQTHLRRSRSARSSWERDGDWATRRTVPPAKYMGSYGRTSHHAEGCRPESAKQADTTRSSSAAETKRWRKKEPAAEDKKDIGRILKQQSYNTVKKTAGSPEEVDAEIAAVFQRSLSSGVRVKARGLMEEQREEDRSQAHERQQADDVTPDTSGAPVPRASSPPPSEMNRAIAEMFNDDEPATGSNDDDKLRNTIASSNTGRSGNS